MPDLQNPKTGEIMRASIAGAEVLRARGWTDPGGEPEEPTVEPEGPSEQPDPDFKLEAPDRNFGSRDAWAEYAQALGVGFAEDAGRNDIIAAVEAAAEGAQAGAEPEEPDLWDDRGEGSGNDDLVEAVDDVT